MRNVQNLLNVPAEIQQAFLDSFDYVLTDCDGTVWNLSHPIDGAGEGITLLQNAGKKFVFVTNNSTRSDNKYELKFQQSHINASMEDVMHPGTTVVSYLHLIKFTGLIYVIGTDVLKNRLRESGFQIIDGPDDRCEESYEAIYTRVIDDLPIKAVIIDSDFNVTITKLARAKRYLENLECLFLVGATDTILPFKPNGLFGPGWFYKCLEESTNRKGTLLGKPGLVLRDTFLNKFGIHGSDTKRILFVGDALEQDIGFGKACGFRTLLVLTGTTNENMIFSHQNEHEIPDYYLNSYADFIQIYNNLSVKK